jgi:ParB-like chromosome segregation protein Spo0J
MCRLARIETQSPWNLHPFFDQEPLPDDLAASVREHGILQPPLLLAGEGGMLAVLSGSRRLRALRQTGDHATLCRVVAGGIDKRSLFSLILAEHRWHSPLTLIEKAFFLALAQRFFPADSLAEFCPLLALPPQTREVVKLLALVDLPPEILRAAHYGQISAATVQTLTALSDEDRRAVFSSLMQLHLGDNKQRRFLHLLAEVSELRQKSSAAILQFPEITNILSDQHMNAPQKGQRLLDALTALAAPDSSEAERRFHQWESALALPAGAHIEYSPAFESDALRLILPFAGQRALEAFWRQTRGRQGEPPS